MMKAKKALKRLKRVEAMLSSVLHGYARQNPQIRDLLTAAKTSVSSAKDTIDHPGHQSTARRPVAKTGGDSQKHQTRPIRKGVTRSARKRRSTATQTKSRRVLAQKALKKTGERTVPQRAKLNLRQSVSSRKANRTKVAATSSPVPSRAIEKPVIRSVTPALPARSDQTIAGPVRKPAINNSIATRATQPNRSVEPAPKQGVDAGGVGGEPLRQG